MNQTPTEYESHPYNNYIYGKNVGLINQAPTQYEPNPKKQLYI